MAKQLTVEGIEKLKDKLRDAVLDQIIYDVNENKDVTATDELLKFVPVKNLIQYLANEDSWKEYEPLWKTKDGAKIND